MSRSLKPATLKNARTATLDRNATSLASTRDDSRPSLVVDPPPSSSNCKRKSETEDTSLVKRQRTKSERRVSERTRNKMMEDSSFYTILLEGDETSIPVDPISRTMLETYIRMLKDKSMLKEFLFSDTPGYYKFIEFLDQISSKSLSAVIEVLAQEIRCDGNKEVFMALENYLDEQAMEPTVLSLHEKAYLEKEWPYQKSPYLSPIKYRFDDNVYILLKIKVFEYTLLTSKNARWLISGSRFNRLESSTKLERSVQDFETLVGRCVKCVDSPNAKYVEAFDMLNTEIHYFNDQEDEEDSGGEDDDDSCYTNVSVDFDSRRVDGGGNFYYEGATKFDKLTGFQQHGRGEMVEYPIDARNRPLEVNRSGIYISNTFFCECECPRSTQCICRCHRKVGEASSDDSDDDDTDDEDDDDDYERCAFNRNKREMCTHMESQTMSLRYCQPCAEYLDAIEDNGYYHRLFKVVTGVDFTGEDSEMMALFDKMNPHTTLVRQIETFEDYVQLLKPSEHWIRQLDERLEDIIRLIKNNI